MQHPSWAHREAQHAIVPDPRYRRVVAETLAATLGQADVSFSQACGGALRQAVGRLAARSRRRRSCRRKAVIASCDPPNTESR